MKLKFFIGTLLLFKIWNISALEWPYRPELLNADELAMLSDLPTLDPRDPGFTKQIADTIKLRIDHYRQETTDAKLQLQ